MMAEERKVTIEIAHLAALANHMGTLRIDSLSDTYDRILAAAREYRERLKLLRDAILVQKPDAKFINPRVYLRVVEKSETF